MRVMMAVMDVRRHHKQTTGRVTSRQEIWIYGRNSFFDRTYRKSTSRAWSYEPAGACVTSAAFPSRKTTTIGFPPFG